MRFVELFYDLMIGKDLNDGGKNYEFWGILPDGQFFFVSPKKEFDFIHYDRERDEVSYGAKSALFHIMNLEEFPGLDDPLYINYEDYTKYGYCLGFIPACNTEKIIETHSYTAKWPDIFDYNS